MHLRNVEIFCEVVTRRSFSKAAELFHVSQSAASQAVIQLEKRLGTELLDRSVRPFELTPAGEIYFSGCKELLSQFRDIEDRVQRIGDRVTGRIRIAAIYSVGLLQMSTYVEKFRQRFPDVELHLDYLHPSDVYDHVSKEESDLGLMSFPTPGHEFDVIPWIGESMVAVVPCNHPLAGERGVSISQLENEPFVSFTSDLRIRRELDRWLKKANVHVENVYEFDSIEHVKRAVEIGTGISILPEPTVHRERDNETLAVLKLKDVDWVRPLGMIHKRGRTLTSALTKFTELLLSETDSGRKDQPRRPKRIRKAKRKSAAVAST